MIVQDFEETASGTTISAANTAPTSSCPQETAFTTVALSSGVSATFDNSRAAHMTQSALMNSGASAGTAKLTINTPYVTATQSCRLHLYFTANPGASTTFLYVGITAGTLCARFHVNTNGTIGIDTATGNNIVTTTNSIPLNQWIRVEVWVTGSATVGQASLSLFTNIDSSTALETITTSAVQNTTGVPGLFQFGITNVTLANNVLSLDDIAIDQGSGPIGPAPAARPTTSDTGSAVDASNVRVTASDTGSGADSSLVDLAASDSGSGAESSTIRVSDSDSGSGAESSVTSATIPGADSGSGAESASLSNVSSDVGSGADSASVNSLSPSSDSGSGLESASVRDSSPASDSGAGSESAFVGASSVASDSGSGTESALVSNAVVVSDLLSGTDSASTASSVAVSDSASGVDSATVRVVVAVSESASCQELFSVGAFAPELCSMIDNSLVSAIVSDSDSGTGAEMAVATSPGGGMLMVM